MFRFIAGFCFFINVFLVGYSQQRTSFIREYIDFKLDSSYFSIHGIYTFVNNSDKFFNQSILYPFLSSVTTIDSIRVINITGQKVLKYNRTRKGIIFHFPTNPNDTVDIAIFYRQKTSKINTYILTTTQYWGKPLEIANYSLTVLKSFNVLEFSIPPDSISSYPQRKVYYWNKANFMPETDFSIIIP